MYRTQLFDSMDNLPPSKVPFIIAIITVSLLTYGIAFAGLWYAQSDQRARKREATETKPVSKYFLSKMPKKAQPRRKALGPQRVWRQVGRSFVSGLARRLLRHRQRVALLRLLAEECSHDIAHNSCCLDVTLLSSNR
jgi:hypothetical protein